MTLNYLVRGRPIISIFKNSLDDSDAQPRLSEDLALKPKM